MTKLVLVGGATRTARIEGITVAGASPDLLWHTPSADLEILEYGRPIKAPVAPVSPSGCPTPAVVTRAVRELVGFETLAIDAGLARPTATPTVKLADSPGGDVRAPTPVPEADRIVERAREFGRALPGPIAIGETIPGGTTTALGVLTALGERPSVSSSLAENPLELKRRVVRKALDADGLAPGDAADNPVRALRAAGDPVLAAVTGLVMGAIEAGTVVTLAGGTQLAAVAALVRHAGVDVPLDLATTSFLAADSTADLEGLADTLDCTLSVTDPGFAGHDHPAMAAYARGEAKEGVGMGGALALAVRSGVAMDEVREQVCVVYDRLLDGQ